MKRTAATYLSKLVGTIFVLFLIQGCTAPQPAPSPADTARAELNAAPEMTMPAAAARATRNPERICVIGLDALTLDILTPMMESGELPNIRKLRDSGASGTFHPQDKMLYSPRIWTTIATGKRPEKHGISFFLIDPIKVKSTGQTAGSDLRTCLAVWNIFSHFRKSVHVSNYMVTWPAETVNGSVLSDYFYLPRGTYPPDIEAELTARFVAPEWRDPHTQRLITRLAPWYEGSDQLSRGEDKKLQNLLECIRRDEICLEKTTEMVADAPPELAMIYIRSVDLASHFYWKYSQLPRNDDRLKGLDTNIERFGGLLPEMYRWADEWVGRIVAAFPPDTIFFVISDHGFRTLLSEMRVYNLMRLLRDMGWAHFPVNGDMIPVAADTSDPIDIVRRIYLVPDRVGDYSASTGEPAGSVADLLLDRLTALRTRSGKFLFTAVPVAAIPLAEGESAPDLAVRFNADLRPDDRVTVNGRDVRMDQYIEFMEQSGNHDPSATIVVSGPGVSQGYSILDARPMDMTPTLLALADLPVADDMDGVPRMDFFTPELRARHSLARIDTYEGRIPRTVEIVPESQRPVILDQLKSLGYIK